MNMGNLDKLPDRFQANRSIGELGHQTEYDKGLQRHGYK